MKVYIIDDNDIAIQLCQLLKLNSECFKLHWSRKIKNVPQNVMSSLETIESYIESKVYESCTSKNLVGELSEEDELLLMTEIKKTSELRNTLGNGVILAGKQNEELKKMIVGRDIPKVVVDAINIGKNIILF